MISESELRAEMNLPEGEDFTLASIRSEVVSLFERETGRPWDRRVGHVEIFDPVYVPGRDLLLELWPVETIASVKTLGRDESTWTTRAASTYMKIGTRTLRSLSGDWPRETAIEVTYTGGVTDAAPDIKRALIVQAQFMRQRTASEKLITQSQNFEGGAGVFLKPDLHPLFERAVKQHARRA